MSAPAAALPLSDGERETLERLARAQSVPHRHVLQALFCGRVQQPLRLPLMRGGSRGLECF